jgi:hypothetical protein
MDGPALACDTAGMPKRSRMPSDMNQLAAAVVSQATGETPAEPKARRRRKNPAAVALGRRGGKKGGPARAAKLSPARRAEIARKAARSRWARATEPA